MELLKIFKNTGITNPVQSEVMLNRLKEMDDISAIEFSSQRLNLDLKRELFHNDEYLNYFLTIDDKTRMIVEKVTDSYVKIDIINHQHKARIASAAFLHHRLMFSIYFKLIVSLAPSKHPALTMLLGRAINNAAEIIKWRYFNKQSAPGNVWLQMANLYDMAEKHGLSNEKMAFYPDLVHSEFIPNTIASAYISICMLGSLDSISFKAQQIDFIIKMLSKWTGDIEISNEYNEKKHIFFVDISKNMPAKRIRNYIPNFNNRFWCLDRINTKIQILMNCIETGTAPKQKSMKVLAQNIYAFKTLQTIQAEWSLSEYRRQRRESPRIKTDKVATNFFGFEDVYYQIKHFEDSLVEIKQQSFSESQQDEMQRALDDMSKAILQHKKFSESMTAFMHIDHGHCNIVDESAKGFGLHVSKQAHELEIGMMLGIAMNDQKFGIKIGIIRSIKPTLNNTLRIGVEIIGRNAFSVEAENVNLISNDDILNHAISDEEIDEIIALEKQHANIAYEVTELDLPDAQIASHQFNCLFLPKEFSFLKEDTLIMPKNQFQKNDTYSVNIANNIRKIQPMNTLEEHENWIRLTFLDC